MAVTQRLYEALESLADGRKREGGRAAAAKPGEARPYSHRKRPAAMSVVARPMPPTIVTWSRSKP